MKMMPQNPYLKNMKVSFREWFYQDYLTNISIHSPLINGSKNFIQKQDRICVVAEMLLEGKDTDYVRNKTAFIFFVSLRTALDYVNYAKILIDGYLEKHTFKE